MPEPNQLTHDLWVAKSTREGLRWLKQHPEIDIKTADGLNCGLSFAFQ
jgi:hypothetical protein